MQERPEQETTSAERAMTPLSVPMIDVDFFQRFNGQNGPAAGEQALVKVAVCLRAAANRQPARRSGCALGR